MSAAAQCSMEDMVRFLVEYVDVGAGLHTLALQMHADESCMSYESLTPCEIALKFSQLVERTGAKRNCWQKYLMPQPFLRNGDSAAHSQRVELCLDISLSALSRSGFRKLSMTVGKRPMGSWRPFKTVMERKNWFKIRSSVIAWPGLLTWLASELHDAFVYAIDS